MANYLLAFFTCLFALGVISHGWMTEDAYITLRVVDNFVHGFGLRWNVDERVQVFTHPLWLMVITPFYALTLDGFYTIILLGAAFSIAAFFLPARQWMAVSPLAVLFFCACLLSSRAVLEFSTGGLENPLAMCILSVFYLLLQKKNPATGRHWLHLHLAAALLLLTRFDTILLIVPALGILWYRHGRKELLLPAFYGLVPFFLWEIFSLLYYGFPFPNTKYAKLDYTGLSALDHFYQSRFYLLDLVRNHLPTAFLMTAAVFAGLYQARHVKRAWPASTLLAAGVLLYVGYVVWIGGDHYSGRYWAVPGFLAALVLAGAIATTKTTTLAKPLVVGLVLSLLTGYLIESKAPFGPGQVENAYLLSRGTLTLFDYNPGKHNWAAHGMELRKLSESSPSPLVILDTGVGLRGFFAGPKVVIIDSLGITDPLMARLPVADRNVWHAGHYWRKIPSGYIARRFDKGILINPSLNHYYQRLRMINTLKIWSWERLKTIVLFNAGVYDHLRKRYIVQSYYNER